ncbi:hypothetical protein [Xanthomonas arboricola]|uniref:hypothetical protein n=1 Tax=Xanthomonas arboricola TaxID=56448 RepID=UPI000E0E1808|nr:hypothetical protein [Xanthomonas arboricola]
MTAPLRPPLSRLWLPDQDGGTALQLTASVEGREHALLTVLADPRDESLWVAVQADGTQVQVPLAVLRQLLEVATDQVHSADWFARQDAADSEG